MKFNLCKLIVAACVLFGNMAWAVEEPNDIIGACYFNSYITEDSGSCPSWELALLRYSTDTQKDKYLKVELDGCQIIDYDVYMVEQYATPEPKTLQENDLWVVWDEDFGHGSTIDFNYTGSYEVADPDTNCNYARVSSNDESIINWVLYKATSDGTLTINNTGLNEHDVFMLQRNYLTLEKFDDVNDCTLPNDEFRYTICFNNTSNYAFYGTFIIDYLPDGVDYPAGADTYVFDGNDVLLVEGDPGYSEEGHFYVWELGTIYPGDANCVTLDVVVNNKAMPGTYLHNVAELWADGGDKLIARATEDTLVCCWGDPNVIYVDETATGNNTGVSWKDAYVDLADALERAAITNCGTTPAVYVAQGTYDPNQTPDKSFILPPGCSVFGGFRSGGCDFSERNPKRYKTTLAGLINEQSITFEVVTMGNGTLLDGFTVTNAFEQAIYGNGANFTISDSTIHGSFGHGIYALNGDVDVQWCNIRLNNADGIRHEGEGYALSVSNSWILRNGECGIYCNNSTPQLFNNIISESDLTRQGRAGIRLYRPSYQPVLHNLTVSNNKAEGIFFTDNGNVNGDPNFPDYPDLQNSIVFYNNRLSGGSQLAGLNPDRVANFCCIQDCNEPGTTNYNRTPGFAYVVDPNGAPDPNNYHLAYDSFCIDKANPFLAYTNQVDIDGEGLDRKYGDYVDIGADEVYDCSDDILTDIDVHNDLDQDADGIVNFTEMAAFSRSWLSRDPNSPLIITDPNFASDPDYADPNTLARWRQAWNPKCNLIITGDSVDKIDLADLMEFTENGFWLWVACWKLEEIEATAAQSQSQSMMMQPLSMMTMEIQTVESEPEPSLDTLVQIIGFLNEVVAENPDNIENIQDLRAILMDDIWAIWSRQNE